MRLYITDGTVEAKATQFVAVVTPIASQKEDALELIVSFSASTTPAEYAHYLVALEALTAKVRGLLFHKLGLSSKPVWEDKENFKEGKE